MPDLKDLFPGALADLFAAANVPHGDRPAGVDPSSPAEALRRACAHKAARDAKRTKTHADVANELEAALRKFRAGSSVG